VPFASRRDQGTQGEAAAERHLKSLGWRILERNYRAQQAEIDLIALDGDEVVFVEVKTLAAADFGEPEDRVARSKQRQISRAALHYIRERRIEGRGFRFDVVAVSAAEGAPRIEHFRDAFGIEESFRV